jgi:hypothetical protein
VEALQLKRACLWDSFPPSMLIMSEGISAISGTSMWTVSKPVCFSDEFQSTWCFLWACKCFWVLPNAKSKMKDSTRNNGHVWSVDGSIPSPTLTYVFINLNLGHPGVLLQLQ